MAAWLLAAGWLAALAPLLTAGLGAGLGAGEASGEAAAPIVQLEIDPEQAHAYAGDAIAMTWRLTNRFSETVTPILQRDGPAPADLLISGVDPAGRPLKESTEAEAQGPSVPDPELSPGQSTACTIYLNRYFPSLPPGAYRFAWRQSVPCEFRQSGLHQQIALSGSFALDIRPGENPDAQRLAEELFATYDRLAPNDRSGRRRASVIRLCYMDSPAIFPYLEKLLAAEYPGDYQAPIDALFRLRQRPEAQRLLERAFLGNPDFIETAKVRSLALQILPPARILRSWLADADREVTRNALMFLGAFAANAPPALRAAMLHDQAFPREEIAQLQGRSILPAECSRVLHELDPSVPVIGDVPSDSNRNPPPAHTQPATPEVPEGRPDPKANKF
jgi:hypothetical protein